MLKFVRFIKGNIIPDNKKIGVGMVWSDKPNNNKNKDFQYQKVWLVLMSINN